MQQLKYSPQDEQSLMAKLWSPEIVDVPQLENDDDNDHMGR